VLTLFTCPDCGGSLWQADEGPILRFECHVGHAWNWEALLDQKSEQVEVSLWAGVRLLVERATLRRQIAQRLECDNDPAAAIQLRIDADRDEELSQSLWDLLEIPPSEAPVTERL
jgi:two-component system, chemotaxis family, protein-glutamate methylesterase/glutaminase